jgi:hypothetical protein
LITAPSALGAPLDPISPDNKPISPPTLRRFRSPGLA